MTLDLYKILVSIELSFVDPEASSHLATSWVRTHGIPEEARKEPVMRQLAKAIDKLVAIDELSIIKLGPVRVKVRCRDPAKLCFSKE